MLQLDSDVKSQKFIFRREKMPDDLAQYTVLSESEVSRAEAFHCFQNWAAAHPLKLSELFQNFDIRYEEWRPLPLG